MTGRGFLDVADELATGPGEGHWRSAASRANYAAFHFGRALLERCGFVAPRADRAHHYVSMRLSNAGQPDIRQAGRFLEDLRRVRNAADYDIAGPFTEQDAIDSVQAAADLITLFEAALTNAPLLSRITAAMRDYERDVLKDVTWRGP